MVTKECKTCGEIHALNNFYKQKSMADGHINFCKSCRKASVTKNRNENIERYRAYDRERDDRRPSLEHRRKYNLGRIKAYPKQYKSQRAAARAIRSGEIKKLPCQECSSEYRIQAHHNDYNHPLSVRWLCSICHSLWHRLNGPGLNQN